MKLPWTLLTLAYCAFLFWLSSGPAPAPKDLDLPGMDKVAHAAAYGILAALVFTGMARSGRTWRPATLFWTALLFTAFYGATDEFHQWFVPSRSPDLLDWLADTVGALTAGSACLLLHIRRVFPFYRPPLSNS